MLQTKLFMKHIITLLFLSISLITYSQSDIKTNGLFYKISLGSTLTINEEYELFDEYDDSFIIPSAYLVNNTIGYQFDERTSLGLNLEYNWHSKQELHFFPAFLSFRYNILNFDDNIFIRAGYGRLLNMGKNFEKGTLYKVGAGVQLFDDDFKNSLLIGLDFSRKRFGFRQTEKLSSVSIFLEYIVF